MLRSSSVSVARHSTGGLTEALARTTALLVTPDVEQNLMLAARNLAKLEVTTADFLNTYQVLRSDKLLFTRGAFEKLEARLKD